MDKPDPIEQARLAAKQRNEDWMELINYLVDLGILGPTAGPGRKLIVD